MASYDKIAVVLGIAEDEVGQFIVALADGEFKNRFAVKHIWAIRVFSDIHDLLKNRVVDIWNHFDLVSAVDHSEG